MPRPLPHFLLCDPTSGPSTSNCEGVDQHTECLYFDQVYPGVVNSG